MEEVSGDPAIIVVLSWVDDLAARSYFASCEHCC